MPFPFDIPIPLLSPLLTSAFTCSQYPSLPTSLATQRAVLQHVLSRHRKIGSKGQLSDFAEIENAIADYLPSLFTIDASLCDATAANGIPSVDVDVLSAGQEYVWFAPLTTLPAASSKSSFFSSSVSDRAGERPKKEDKKGAVTTEYISFQSFNAEIAFTLYSSAVAKCLHARSQLQLLHSASRAQRDDQQGRNTIIAKAMTLYLEAYSLHDYIAKRSLRSSPDTIQGRLLDPRAKKGRRRRKKDENVDSSGFPQSQLSRSNLITALDISSPVQDALKELCLAEATLVVVLKDDPYPAIVADDRDESVRDWMFRAPQISKFRVTLFSRMCIAASSHAVNAVSLLRSVEATAGSVNSLTISPLPPPPIHSHSTHLAPTLLRYANNLSRVGRAKACRLQGLDAVESQGQYGVGLGWLRAAAQQLLQEHPNTSTDRSSSSSSSSSQTLAEAVLASDSYRFLLPVVMEDNGRKGRTAKPFSAFTSSSRRLVSKITKNKEDDGSGSRKGSQYNSSDPRKEEDKLRRGDSDWGSDAGIYEEAKIIEILFHKWNKMNEAFIYPITPIAELLPTLPSGREYHTTIPPFIPPVLDNPTLQALRAAIPLRRPDLDRDDDELFETRHRLRRTSPDSEHDDDDDDDDSYDYDDGENDSDGESEEAEFSADDGAGKRDEYRDNSTLRSGGRSQKTARTVI